MAAESASYNDRQKVWTLIKDIGIALLVTTGDGGALRGRPMAAMNKDFDGELWFVSQEGTPKLEEIADHGQVLVAYSEPKSQNYVSVSGRARIVRDAAKVKDLWTESARVWFPKGPDDPNIALICVTVDTA